MPGAGNGPEAVHTPMDVYRGHLPTTCWQQDARAANGVQKAGGAPGQDAHGELDIAAGLAKELQLRVWSTLLDRCRDPPTMACPNTRTDPNP